MKDKSRVFNIIVSDLDTYSEYLVRELIKYEISYVQIENEFHFLDKIYRFYDTSNITDLNNLITVMPETTVGLDLLKYKDSLISEEIIFKAEDDVVLNPKRSIPSVNKQFIKSNNKMINQKIRSYKR